MRRWTFSSLVVPLLVLPLLPAEAAVPVVRKAPYDKGSMCVQHSPIYYPNITTTCLVNPPPDDNEADPLDPATTQFNYLAGTARMGVLVGGGYHQLFLPPIPTMYVYNIKRSQSVVYFQTPGPGTLTVSSDIYYAVASFPTPRKYRTCVEAYDVTPGRGPFPFTGHVFLKNDCAFEDQHKTHFSFSVAISQTTPMPIAIEAVLDNTADNGAASGVVENITYTFTPAT